MQEAILSDEDRPGESMTVSMQGFDAEEEWLTVAVPNTAISFALRRTEDGARYRGSLGGRSFVYVVPKRKTSKQKRGDAASGA